MLFYVYIEHFIPVQTVFERGDKITSILTLRCAKDTATTGVRVNEHSDHQERKTLKISCISDKISLRARW